MTSLKPAGGKLQIIKWHDCLAAWNGISSLPALQAILVGASQRFCSPLAFRNRIADMETGRLVVDGPLANRVRSGRKQP